VNCNSKCLFTAALQKIQRSSFYPNEADLFPDYQNSTLTIILHSLSAQRFNTAVFELTKIFNRTLKQFPETNQKIIFEISVILNIRVERIPEYSPKFQ